MLRVTAKKPKTHPLRLTSCPPRHARPRRHLRARARAKWKLERTRAALDVLEERLQTTGARLHRNGWQQCAIRPATQHLTDDQQQALHRIGPRARPQPDHRTAAARRHPRRARRSLVQDRIKQRTRRPAGLLKQCVLLTLPGQAEIIPAPEMIYGLDPDLREPPPLGALSPSAASQKTTPAAPTTTRQPQPASALPNNSRHLTEETETSALNNSRHFTNNHPHPVLFPQLEQV
ncbi:MAG: hypothetical protein M3N47_01650 [Chloroflexota bacterium]|nr:hypothetical protein [Chloroflexota bacterium]